MKLDNVLTYTRANLGKALAIGLLSTFLVGCVAATNSVDISGTKQVSVDRGSALATINAFRRENGVGPVRYTAVLDRAADRQARAMAARGNMSHGLDGRLTDRVTAFGYDWAAVAENLGWNYRSTPAVLTGWENSAGHRKNLLNANVTEAGFAAAVGSDGEPYWALILGRERQRVTRR